MMKRLRRPPARILFAASISITAAAIAAATPTAAVAEMVDNPPRDLLAQGIVGRCSGIDPAKFPSINAFVDAVVTASGGFTDAKAEQYSIDCADTLQLAGEIRDIANPPVTIAIRRLVRDCEVSTATIRTCSALRAILDKAILANSQIRPGIEPDKEFPFVPPPLP